MSDPTSARRTKKDTYSNIALVSCAMSAANTLTFQQLSVSVGLFQGVAMLLHRISFWPNAAACREMVAATDALYMALTTSNRLTSISDVTDPSIIALEHIVGIGVSVEPWRNPIVYAFDALPGGGKLIPANPLFLAVNSAGYGAAATVKAQLDFTFVQLSDADYLELLQSMYPISV